MGCEGSRYIYIYVSAIKGEKGINCRDVSSFPISQDESSTLDSHLDLLLRFWEVLHFETLVLLHLGADLSMVRVLMIPPLTKKTSQGPH